MGYMKLVGETFKDNYALNEKKKTVVLGITNWSTVRGNNSLLVKNVIK